MLELVASLVVDLSDQRLTVYNSDQEVVRVIPVSTGKASTPTPIFNSKVYTKYRSTTMYGRTYTCLLYTSPSPRDATLSRMPSSA